MASLISFQKWGTVDGSNPANQLIVYPEIWENDPIWLYHIFNHHLESILFAFRHLLLIVQKSGEKKHLGYKKPCK